MFRFITSNVILAWPPDATDHRCVAARQPADRDHPLIVLPGVV
jgi:hypothetical protein